MIYFLKIGEYGRTYGHVPTRGYNFLGFFFIRITPFAFSLPAQRFATCHPLTLEERVGWNLKREVGK